MRAKHLSILAMLVLALQATAQQETPEQQEQEATPAANESEQIILPQEPPAPFQEFDPSEEISEDFSVPFPLDI
jgi:hypothetical protein